MDVFADIKEKLDNIEMLNQNAHNLSKRNKVHQGKIDLATLGQDKRFNDLKPRYIIFICTFDPFDDGLYKYTCETCCKETGKPLDDDVKKIFLNTKGKNYTEVSAGLINFLRYMDEPTDECVEQIRDDIISNIHNRVKSRRTYSDGMASDM